MGEVRTAGDVQDLVHGLTLPGAGGGGRPEQGLEAGRVVSWIGPVHQEGAHIGVVGAVADPRLRPPVALDRLGSRHYGYDRPYLPIEQLVRRGTARAEGA